MATSKRISTGMAKPIELPKNYAYHSKQLAAAALEE